MRVRCRAGFGRLVSETRLKQGSLTIVAAGAENSDERLTLTQALRRALRLRCPYCGIGPLFRDLFRMHGRCGHCGTRLEREPGYFLGSAYINYGVTAGTTTISYVVLHFAFGWDNRRLVPLLVIFCVAFPLLFFRFARSLWLSLDCFFDPTGARDVMAASRSEGMEATAGEKNGKSSKSRG